MDVARHTFFQQHPDPMWIYDVRTLGFLDVNSAAVATYGYSREEFLGMTIAEITPERDTAGLMQTMDDPVSAQSRVRRHLLKSGDVIQVDITTQTLDFQGHEARMDCVRKVSRVDMHEAEHPRPKREQGARANDAPELVAAAAGSEALARRLASTLENMSDAFYLLDDQLNFVYLNARAERLLRRNRDELVGQNLWQAFPEAREGILGEVYPRALTQGTSERVELHYAPLDTWFRIRALPGPDGLAVYFSDITREREDREKLRTSEERFRLLARATSDIIWDWDVSGDVVWWNDGVTTILGYDPARVPHRPGAWVEFVHDDDRERVSSGLTATLDGSRSHWSDEYRFRHADGHWLTISDHCVVIRDDAGRAVRLIGCMVDVTERRLLEDRVRQADKMDAVGQLTGGLAHDFNNLLTIILGNADLLADALDDQPRLRNMAEMTLSAAERGAELTSRLLAFARRQPLAPKVTDVNELIGNMDGLLRRTLGEHIDITHAPGSGLWATDVDPRQLEVALLNLAINSRDAMPDGGELGFATENKVLDQSNSGSQEDVPPGDYVVISVSDNGTGMTREIVRRAFEPFFTTKPVGKGNGLGLSMVFGFVNQSGGHIRIQSEPGKGTTVRIYLPRAATAGCEPSKAGQSLTVVGGSEQILVVEDDRQVRDHLVSLLRELGYRVTAAPAGREALEILRQTGSIELLFTDVIMPGGMNGKQLADAALALRPDLKVLFTSGYTEKGIVHNGRLDSGVQLLSKPYRRQELASKLRVVLDT